MRGEASLESDILSSEVIDEMSGKFTLGMEGVILTSPVVIVAGYAVAR